MNKSSESTYRQRALTSGAESTIVRSGDTTTTTWKWAGETIARCTETGRDSRGFAKETTHETN